MQGLWKKDNAEVALAQEIEALEIMKRAKSGGEIVDWNENPENVKEEVLRRNAKAGCNSDGSQTSAGKGDRFRPVNKKKYDKSYDRIFGKK